MAVVIDLPPGREAADGRALITAGALRYNEPMRKPLTGQGTDVFLWHLHRADRDDSGMPSWHNRPFQWSDDPLPKGLKVAANKISSVVTFAVPLHEIIDSQSLVSRIIEPLLATIPETS